MTREARVASVQVGQPRTVGDPEAKEPLLRPWTSAIRKEPVEGPRAVVRDNIEGDRQADLEVHGGPDKAVLAYASANYPFWRAALPDVDFGPGSFGENLTVDGATEDDVSIGDLWRVGSAVLQVSQPRQPCWKLARHLQVDDMVLRVRASGRTGWYLRVVEEGVLEAGSLMTLLQRPHPQWTVARASKALLGAAASPEEAVLLAALPELSEGWRRTLRLRAGAPDEPVPEVDAPEAER